MGKRNRPAVACGRWWSKWEEGRRAAAAAAVSSCRSLAANVGASCQSLAANVGATAEASSSRWWERGIGGGLGGKKAEELLLRASRRNRVHENAVPCAAPPTVVVRPAACIFLCALCGAVN